MAKSPLSVASLRGKVWTGKDCFEAAAQGVAALVVVVSGVTGLQMCGFVPTSWWLIAPLCGSLVSLEVMSYVAQAEVVGKLGG